MNSLNLESKSSISSEFQTNLVSIVIPTYNRSDLLMETLDSVTDQLYRPLEILIIDDGSIDDTSKNIDLWKAQNEADDLSIIYIYQKNKGQSAARNHGLLVSTGEFIQYLDSDDTLALDKIELHVKAFQDNSELMVVYGDSYDLENQTRTEPIIVLSREDGLKRCIRSWTLLTHSPLFRREACIKIGLWNENMQCYEDISYMAAIFCLGLELGYVAGANSYVRAHHATSEEYGQRVSFRGEKDRSHYNVINLYRHNEYILNSFPVLYMDKTEYNTIIVKETFRIVRMLFQVQEKSLGKSLIKRLKLIDKKNKTYLYRLTLALSCCCFRYKKGAFFHESLHNMLFSVKKCFMKSIF